MHGWLPRVLVFFVLIIYWGYYDIIIIIIDLLHVALYNNLFHTCKHWLMLLFHVNFEILLYTITTITKNRVLFCCFFLIFGTIIDNILQYIAIVGSGRYIVDIAILLLFKRLQ